VLRYQLDNPSSSRRVSQTSYAKSSRVAIYQK
jgi:hypothetical protein